MKINTKNDFKQLIAEFKSKNILPYAYALGRSFTDEKGGTIATKWLTVNIEDNQDFLCVFMQTMFKRNMRIDFTELKPLIVDIDFNTANIILQQMWHFSDEFENLNMSILKSVVNRTEKNTICVILYPKKESLTLRAPENSADVFCRLSMISRLKFKPNELNLENIFSLLPTLVWTANGALTIEQSNSKLVEGKLDQISAVDKIPPLYWGAPIPKGVRIADLSRVRLGAYLSPGTTVMHEGFVNFNAGTLGASMVEGRISAGVTIGKNSDLGGGSSVMGTLSGGGKERITIGENCLIGANAGTGISLGDRCTIEAGLYITFGTKVKDVSGMFVKASELSGKSDMLFLKNSTTGIVELRFNKNPNKLNKILHS